MIAGAHTNVTLAHTQKRHYHFFLTTIGVFFSTCMMDCFLYSPAVLGPLFLGLLHKRESPPGTTLPPLIHQVLNLQYDSSLDEQYALEQRKN